MIITPQNVVALCGGYVHCWDRRELYRIQDVVSYDDEAGTYQRHKRGDDGKIVVIERTAQQEQCRGKLFRCRRAATSVKAPGRPVRGCNET